ncbi:dual specificity phosphatase catalytic domain-containing protein [Xylariaceae sp. FL1019]|nr:dual specificity phosphatase catalytic domain-containing protein [Xylariaceae sp. FL1019]
MAIGTKSVGLGLAIAAGGAWMMKDMLQDQNSEDTYMSDPPLLLNHSCIKSYTGTRSRIAYTGVRVFYRRHPQADQLPDEPAPLPLLVFVHGLGGSAAQFNQLLMSLSSCASCLAIDLPGCGRSKFARSWDAYTTDNLADLLETIIWDHREENQGIVMVTHDLGVKLAFSIARSKSIVAPAVMGIVAVCPVVSWPENVVLTPHTSWIPGFMVDLWKNWWRGPESATVKQFLGPDADSEICKLQAAFERQSRTAVVRRMISGLSGDCRGARSEDVIQRHASCEGIQDIPVYLVGGQQDVITPVSKVMDIADCLNANRVSMRGLNDEVKLDTGDKSPSHENAVLVSPRGRLPLSVDDIQLDDFTRQKHEDFIEDPSTPRDHQEPGTFNYIPPQPPRPAAIVEASFIAGGHALLYMPSTVRILAGRVSDFLQNHITGRFSLGWQLQFLSREGKWDVKNLAKWQSVQAVSEPIGGIFRAMKTLREVDEEHCPKVFAASWGGIVKDVIDISHAEPVYDPKSFGDGIRYHKFPTVSKIPPSSGEVAAFIRLVEQIREDQRSSCHYGFNRTGFFVVSYLVERCGYSVQEAIDTFAKARPNGIRHSHFQDRLHVTYGEIGA